MVCHRKRNNRYELGGGLILAIGFPGVHGLSPRSPNRIWDLKANPFDRHPEFVPHILTQSEPNQEWFAARSVPCAASRVTMVDKWCRFAVWDVTSTYAKIATRIIQNMNSVAHSFRCGVCSSQRDSFVARPLRAYVLYGGLGMGPV